MNSSDIRSFISFLVYGKEGILLTDEQWQAVTIMNKNILLSASAGSGKTTVLVARILYHLYTNCHTSDLNINNFLAITFTNNSAKKMKNDLKKCLKLWFDLEKNIEIKQFINQQINLLNDCFIMTFDAFCLEIVKTYYMFLPYNFQRDYLNYIENSNNLFLLNKIKKTVISKILSNPKYECFNNSKFNYNLLMSFNNLMSIFNIQDIINKSRTYLVNDKFDNDLLVKVYEIAKYLYTPIKQKYNLIYDLDDYCTYQNLEEFFDNIKNLNAKEFPEYKNLVEYLVSLANDFKFIEDSEIELNNKFYDLIIDLKNEYYQLKLENKIVEFNDIANWVIDIFSYNLDIVEKYKQLFYEILIDEYQDTNDLQEKVLSFIVLKNNVFRVGDIKQAIYGFRNANPKLMNNLYELYRHDDNSINLMLSKNFRSHHRIIDFNNLVYEPLMNTVTKDSFIMERDLAFAHNTSDKNDAVFFKTLNIDEIYDFLSENDILLDNKSKLLISRTNNQLLKIKNILDSKVSINFKQDKLLSEDLLVTLFVSCIFVILKSENYEFHLLNLITGNLFNVSFDEVANCSEFVNERGLDCFESDLFKSLVKLRYLSSINEIFNGLYKILAEMEYDLFQIDYLINLYNDSYDDDPYNFSEFWNEILNKKINVLKSDSDINNLDLMTIHGSKGLEYDDVILIGSDKSLHNDQSVYIFNQDIGIFVKYVDENDVYNSNILLKITNLMNKIEEINEDLRLLYVATTRAKKRLFILNLNTKNENSVYDKNINLFFSNNNYYDYLFTFKQGEFKCLNNQ